MKAEMNSEMINDAMDMGDANEDADDVYESMMFTKEKIKPENSLLQKHKESTLERQQRERLERRAAIANKLKDLDKEVK